MPDYNTMFREMQAGVQKDWGTIEREAIRDQGYWGSKPKSTALPAAKAAAPAVPVASKPINVPTPSAPKLDLPSLTLSPETSVVDQLGTLSSKDSMLRQQARIGAQETGVASGAIHGSQQAGAAERAVLDKIQPLAVSEANRLATEQVENWKQKTNELMTVYESKYAERLLGMNLTNQRQIAMASANTQLTGALMNNFTSLLNNPNLDLGPEVYQKLIDVMNPGLDNNNLTLDMGFTY